MALVRMRDRRTITLTNFTFADGEVDLVHPADIPFLAYDRLLHTQEGLEEYFEFSFAEGVTSDQDYLFLSDITVSEAREVGEKLRAHLGLTEASLEPGGDSDPLELSAAQEAEIADFVREMGLTPDAFDPFDKGDEGEDGDDGLASV